MGSIVSATAADERARQRRLERREKRERRRRRRLLRQQPQHDESGNPLHYDKHGNQFFYDSKGNPFYVNEAGVRFYLDDKGAPYYLETNGEHFYLDENGDKFYLDENREPYYVDEKGKKYFMDTEGKKYYIDNNGKPDLAKGVESLNENDNETDQISDKFKQRRMGMNSQQKSENSVNSVPLDDAEMLLRSPASPPESIKRIGYSDIGNNKARNGKSKSKMTQQTPYSLNHSSILDHAESMELVEIPDETSDTFLNSTLSSYSTLSFVRSEYETSIARTPEYIKDESKESETRVDAQIEAEKKLLRKLLQNEKERKVLPPSKTYRKVGNFKVKIQEDTKDCLISGQAFLPDGNLIIVDFNNRRLKLFNQELEFLTFCATEVSPQSICSGAKDQLVHVLFKTRQENLIQIMNCENNKIVMNQNIRIYESPYAIARSNQGIALIVNDPNKGWRLNLMDLRCRISTKVDLGEVLLDPKNLAITKDLKIVICDGGSNCVFCFDPKGEELFKYKQLRDPKGICTDNNGSLFITSPGVIHQVSESGERIKALMRTEMIGFAPLGVCFDPEDSLMIVTGESNNIVAFELT